MDPEQDDTAEETAAKMGAAGSFDYTRRLVRAALRARYPLADVDIEDLFPDRVVFRLYPMGGPLPVEPANPATDLFEATYTVGEAGAVELGLPESVAVAYEAVKALLPAAREPAAKLDSPPAAASTAVKATADGWVEGLGIPFGGPHDGKDSDGEFFHAGTDFALAWYDKRPVIYHHALKAGGPLDREKVGDQLQIEPRTDGHWIKAQLDLSTPGGKKVWAEAQAGKLFWSSGSVQHLVRKSAGGRIDRWPVIEFSLTPTPANAYAVAGPAVKAAGLTDPIEVVESCRSELSAKAGRVLSAKSRTAVEAALKALQELLESVDAKPAAETAAKARHITATVAEEIIAMDRTELDAILDEREAQRKADADAKDATAAAAKAQLDEAVKAALVEAEERMAAKARADALAELAAKGRVALFPEHTADSAVEVDSKYDDLSAADLAFMAHVLTDATKAGVRAAQAPSEGLLKALAAKSYKAVAKGEMAEESVKSIPVKANELMQSTLAGQGDEWVPDLHSNELWRKIRLDADVAKAFRFINMPSNPYELPLMGADPTWYKVGETADAATLLLNALNTPSSVASTGKQTLTASKLGALTFFSGEFDEDSIIPVAATLREQMEQSGMHALDDVLLNGDTAAGANTNINLIDGTPAGSAKYLVFNGLRKLALVTTTANALSVGALTSASYRQLLALMGPNGKYGIRKADTLYVIDSGTYYATLGLAEAMAGTAEGGFATFVDGDIERVWGRRLITSEDLPLANTAGKVSATPGNNTKGSIVTVNTTRWLGGYRREMRMEFQKMFGADATGIFAHVRVAFTNFDAESSAVGYNVSL